MRPKSLSVILAAAAVAFSASAQMSTPPATPEEKEAAYTTAIDNRATDILKLLEISDEAKSNKVHDIIMAQYRALRARDEKIDSKLRAAGKDIDYANREADFEKESKPLHEQFLAKLSAELTPEQIEKVKDKMTYNKVKVTYDAYNNIAPNLSEEDKAKIMEQLKLAREEAMDGGSAPEKSDIFQKYKNKINAYLATRGIDMAKLSKEWEAKQEAMKKNANAAK
jgi:hypothetical protein